MVLLQASEYSLPPKFDSLANFGHDPRRSIRIPGLPASEQVVSINHNQTSAPWRRDTQ